MAEVRIKAATIPRMCRDCRNVRYTYPSWSTPLCGETRQVGQIDVARGGNPVIFTECEKMRREVPMGIASCSVRGAWWQPKTLWQRLPIIGKWLLRAR